MDEGYKKLLQDLSNHSKFLSKFDTFGEDKQTAGIDTGLDLISQLLGYNIVFSNVVQNETKNETKNETDINNIDDSSWGSQMDSISGNNNENAGSSSSDAGTSLNNTGVIDPLINNPPPKAPIIPEKIPQQFTKNDVKPPVVSDPNEVFDAQKVTVESKIAGMGNVKPKDSSIEGLTKIEEETDEKFANIYYKYYIKLRQCLNSELLTIIGAIHFNDRGLLQLSNDQKAFINNVKKNLFIQLTDNEYERLNLLIEQTEEERKEVFDIIIKRDSKYSVSPHKNCIMIYALPWILHFAYRGQSIVASEPLYDQIVSNKSIFENNLIIKENIQEIGSITTKMIEQTKLLETYKKDIVTGKGKNIYNTILKQYQIQVQGNKSVLALLKRRDDWNNAEKGITDYLHRRFVITPDTISETHIKPITLSYNDTPLKLEDKTKQYVSDDFTHQYNYYGFDHVFGSITKNADIATQIEPYAYIGPKPKKKEKFEGDYSPFVFIGYGQSGSGKTSTLVYLDFKDEDGILMELIYKLRPKTIKCSMIEIYERQAAIDSDTTCIGIKEPTSKNYVFTSKEKKILGEELSNKLMETAGDVVNCIPGKTGQKNRLEIPGIELPVKALVSNDNNASGVLRRVTIGEVLDKAFEEAGKFGERKTAKASDGRNSGNNLDDDDKTVVEFNRVNDRKYSYTHKPDASGHVNGLDKDFTAKSYILRGFECREIAPTGNNKQSSRSHVVVYLECIYDNGKIQPIYVCDLAGVENVFNCNNGSEDILRMKAKTKGNKNYAKVDVADSYNAGFFNGRAGNMVKYIHNDVIKSKSATGVPFCFPDGSPNDAGDPDGIADKYLPTLIKEWALSSPYYVKGVNQPGVAPKSGMDFSKPQLAELNGEKGASKKACDGFVKKITKTLNLKDSPIVVSGLEKTLRKFWGSANQALKKKGRSAALDMWAKEQIDWNTVNQSKLKQWKDVQYANRIIGPAQMVFGSMSSPNCVEAYNVGFQKACEIRRLEGYVINATLRELTKDLTRIAKKRIKERTEDVDNAKPILFGDTYDSWEKIALSQHPLLDWYDINDPLVSDFGLILTSMCMLKEREGKDINDKWSKSEKLDYLKQFKYTMVTVLNETYIMNLGKEARTPAGNLIYVNNPPLPPYVNVSELQKKREEWLFYKNDPRKLKWNSSQKDADVKIPYKDEMVLSFKLLLSEYINLLVRLYKYDLYQEQIVMTFKEMMSSASALSKLNSEKDVENILVNGVKNNNLVKFIETSSQTILDKVLSNNSATYIGTIETTEQVNRVASKTPNSFRLNITAEHESLKTLDKESYNNQAFKILYNCVNKSREGATGEITSNSVEPGTNIQGIYYESLYLINDMYTKGNIRKQLCTMKEKDIYSILVAIESVFPIMTKYIDARKLDNLWEWITKNSGMRALASGEEYPFPNDKVKDTVFSGEQQAQLNTLLEPAIKAGDGCIRKLNELIVNFLKAEPSPYHVSYDNIGLITMAAKRARGKSFEVRGFMAHKPEGLTWPRGGPSLQLPKYTRFMNLVLMGDLLVNKQYREHTETKPTISIMKYLAKDEFTINVYTEFLSDTQEKSAYECKLHKDECPVKPEMISYINPALTFADANSVKRKGRSVGSKTVTLNEPDYWIDKGLKQTSYYEELGLHIWNNSKGDINNMRPFALRKEMNYGTGGAYKKKRSRRKNKKLKRKQTRRKK
uniref:Kinesin motor domain-containing protein n=1 Tax=viral metagenome TaxID=1070528 RepID=A0A6C0CQU4_9ZZZZ